MVFLFGSGMGAAQSTLGSLSGTVKDATGAVIPGATIEVVRSQDGSGHTSITDAAGNYAHTNLEPGTYRLRAQHTGFTAQVANNITLLARQQLSFDVVLSAGAHGRSGSRG